MDIEQKLSNLSFVRGSNFYKSANKWSTAWNVLKKGPKYLDELILRGAPADTTNALIQPGTTTDRVRKALDAAQFGAGQYHGQAGDKDHYGSAAYFANQKGSLADSANLENGTQYSGEEFVKRYADDVHKRTSWFRKEFPNLFATDKDGNEIPNVQARKQFIKDNPSLWARKFKSGEEMAPSVYDRVSGGMTGLALGLPKSRRWMFNKDTIGPGAWKPFAKLGLPPALGLTENFLANSKEITNMTDKVEEVGDNIGEIPGTIDKFVKNIKEFGGPIKKYALPFAGSALGSALGAAGGHLLSKDTSGMSEEKRREEERRQRQRKALMTLGGLGLGGLGGAYLGGAFDSSEKPPAT